jgi:hypothetical protein
MVWEEDDQKALSLSLSSKQDGASIPMEDQTYIGGGVVGDRLQFPGHDLSRFKYSLTMFPSEQLIAMLRLLNIGIEKAGGDY